MPVDESVMGGLNLLTSVPTPAQEAWDSRIRETDYAVQDATTRQKIRDQFVAEVPGGAAIYAEHDNQYNSFFKNMAMETVQGARDTFDAARLLDDVITGKIDPGTAKQIADTTQRQAGSYKSPAAKKMEASLAAINKNVKQADTSWEKAKAWGAGAGDALLHNKEGMALLTARSLSNSALGIAGAAAGAISPVPGGAALGQFTGELATEAPFYFVQLVQQEAHKRKLPASEQGFQQILNDTEFVNEAREKSGLKGLGTAATDTAFGMLVGGMVSKFARQAEKSAIKALPGASKEAIAAEAAATLKQISKTAKAGNVAKILATEIASEPLSEVAGTVLAGDGIDPAGAAGELLGGIGQGPVMAPINLALHGTKTASQVVSEKVKESANPDISVEEAAKKSILGAAYQATKKAVSKKTPEDLARQAEVDEQKKVEKDLKQQAKAPAAHKYKEKVAAAVETGDVDTAMAENPIKGVDVLHGMSQKEEATPIDKIKYYEQSKEAYDKLEAQKQELIKEATVLNAKVEDGTITVTEKVRRQSIGNQAISINAMQTSIAPAIKSMNPQAEVKLSTEEQAEASKQVHEALKSGDPKVIDQSILSLFGSKNSSEAVEKALQSPEIAENTKVKLKGIQEYNLLKNTYETKQEEPSWKSTSEVNTDVIRGGEGYKGIEEYNYAIAKGIEAGDTTFVSKQLEGLANFAQRHTDKAELFQRILDAGGTETYFKKDAEGKMTPQAIEDSALMAELNESRKKQGATTDYNIHKRSADFVSGIVLEAQLLDKALDNATDLVTAVHGDPEYVEGADTSTTVVPPIQSPEQDTRKPGFTGYKSGFENTGKGTIQGDGKDKAMREVADGFIGEAPSDRIHNSSTGTSYKEISKQDNPDNLSAGTLTHINEEAKTVMLARNGQYRGKELAAETKEAIQSAHDKGASFVVGDMPGVDSQFIDHLDEIGASYEIYHTGNTPRITKTSPEQDTQVGDGVATESPTVDVPTQIPEPDRKKLIDLGFSEDDIAGLKDNEKKSISAFTELPTERLEGMRDSTKDVDQKEFISKILTGRTPEVINEITIPESDAKRLTDIGFSEPDIASIPEEEEKHIPKYMAMPIEQLGGIKDHIEDSPRKTLISQIIAGRSVETTNTVKPTAEPSTESVAPGSTARLQWIPNTEVIGVKTETGFSPTVAVNSLDELTTLSAEYDNLVRERHGSAAGLSNIDSEPYLKVFQDLAEVGIPFKAMTLKCVKDAGSRPDGVKMLGSANIKKGVVTLATGHAREGISPLKVVLHEYTHMITVGHLDSKPDLKNRVRNLMNHSLKQNPTLKKEYGFVNEREFLAEVISNPTFQEALHKLKPTQGKSIVGHLQEIFNSLLQRLTKKEVSALTEALGLTVEAATGNNSKETADVLPTHDNSNTSEDPETQDVPDGYQTDTETRVGTSDPEENSSKPGTKEKDTEDTEEGSQDEKDPVVPIQETLTTIDPADPDNLIKRDFEPDLKAGEKNILQRTNDLMKSLFRSTVEKLDIFNDSNPLDQDAENVLASMRTYGEQFHKAVDSTYEFKNVEGTSPSNIDNFLKGRNFIGTDGKVNKDLKAAIRNAMGSAAKDAEMPWGKSISTSDMIDFVTKNKKLLQAKIRITPTKANGLKETQEISAYHYLRQRLMDRTKNNDFRHRDPIQYLADKNGQLHPQVVNALMAASYEWLGTMATGTLYNKPDAVRKILGLSSGQEPSAVATAILGKMGHTSNMLSESIGKTAFKLLAIKPWSNADFDMQSRLEQSLGLQAIAAMEKMGLLTSEKVFTGFNAEAAEKDGFKMGKVRTGLTGLANSHNWKYSPSVEEFQKHFTVPKNDRTKEARITFYRLVQDSKSKEIQAAPGILHDFITPFNKSKNTWNMLFKGERSSRMYSWAPEKRKGKAPLKGTPFNAADEQNEMLGNHESKPRKASIRTMGLSLLLGKDNMRKINGYVDPETQHLIHRDGVVGKNLDILNNEQAIEEWLEDAAKQENGYESEFYINEEFWPQGRMGETGPIGPQGSKHDRAMFNFSAWERTLDLTDDKTQDQFMEAVALNMDIETTKKGGLAKTLTAVKKLLKTDVVAAGVSAIQDIIEQEGNLDTLDLETLTEGKYPDQVAAITEAAMKIGMGTRGVKAMLEYARSLSSTNKTKFTTDLSTEIDGVGNGIAIARLQFMGFDIDMSAIQASLQNAGMFFTKPKMMAGLAKHLGLDRSFDAYMNTGFQWDLALQGIETNLLRVAKNQKSKQNEFTNQLGSLQALKNIFGDFRDKKGVLQGVVRKLSKAPTMTTIFGMMEKSLFRGLNEAFIDKIYTNIEDAVAEGDMEVLLQINQDVETLTGNPLWADTSTLINSENEINTEMALGTRLPNKSLEEISATVEKFHGTALAEAIETVYGDLKRTVKPFNDGISYAAAMYNTMRNLRIKQRKTLIEIDAKRDGIEPRKLNLDDIATIDKALLEMFPFINTVFESKMALVKKDKTRSYGKDPIEQTYQKGMSVKRTTAATTGGVADPGVRGTILSIHNLDSVIALNLMDFMDALNNHDGFTVGVGDGIAAANKLNKVFYETNYKHSIGMKIFEGVSEVRKEFKSQFVDMADDPLYTKQSLTALVQEEMVKVLRTTKLGAPRNGEKHWTKFTTDNYKAIIDRAMADMEATAKITHENKKKVMDAIVGMEQYSYPGGHFETGNRGKAITHEGQKYNAGTVTERSEARIAEEEEIGLALWKEAEATRTALGLDPKKVEKVQASEEDIALARLHDLQSSGKAEDLSTNPDDYATAQQISSMNAVNVFNHIKNDGVVKLDPDHDAYLQRLLSGLVSKVMNPIDLFMKLDPSAESEGKYQADKKRIFISTQNYQPGPIHGALRQGIRMSTGEVYTHELLHNILHFGLQSNPRLRKQVEALFKIAHEKLEASGEGYKQFLNNPDIDVTDPAYFYEVEAAKDRYNYIFNNTRTKKIKIKNSATGITDTREYSPHIDEFAVLGLSNKNFLKFLSTIDLSGTSYTKNSWKDVIGKNVQETLGNILQKVMDFFYRKFSSKTTNATMDQELLSLAHLLAEQDTEQKSNILKATQALESKTSSVSEWANEYIKKGLTSWPVVKVFYNIKKSGEFIKESDTMLGQRIRETVLRYRRLDHGIIKSMISEGQGRTERLDWIHSLLGKRHLYLDAGKTTETETYIAGTADMFTELKDGNGKSRKIADKEKVSITKVLLKPDTSVLYNWFKADGLQKLLEKPGEIGKQIKAIKRSIQSDPGLAPYLAYYDNACNAQGYYMVHSRGRSGEDYVANARLIAEAKDTPLEKQVTQAQANKAEPLVDVLGSLYALKYSAGDHKQTVSNLLKQDPDAINGVIRMHEVLKANALRDSFGGNKYKFTKGYVKQITNPNIGYVQGTMADKVELEKQGFIQQGVIARDKAEGSTRNTPFYVYTSNTGRVNDYAPGVLSVTNNKARGISTESIARKTDISTAEGKRNNEYTIKQKMKIRADMCKPGYKPKREKGNFMSAQVDDAGKITQYRYTMAETTKDDHLEQINDFDTILGSMAGQIVDKVRTPEINKDLIKGLKDMHDKEYHDNPGAFIEVGPNSKNARGREVYYMMPAAARAFMKSHWQQNHMQVSKDVMDMAFGYRQYSIVDAFSKTPGERAALETFMVRTAKLFFKDKAVHVANTVESTFMEMTKVAKSNIIVKSAYVTMGNLGSNMVYLRSKGVPVSKIFKLGWEAAAMGNKYQVDIKKLNQLKLKREMAKKNGVSKAQLKKMRSEIARLADTISRNPVTKAVESGMMPALVDDVETVTGGTNFPTGLEKKAAKITSKFPILVQNVGKTVLMTEDTKSFKILNNAVKMTDFIGRYVLYDHYTSQGMEHKEAVAAVTDEFVNFDIPTHRMVEWGNTIGFLRFTKYGTRILKTIKNAAVDKPFTFFSTLAMSNGLGLDNIANSVPGVTKGVFANAGTAPTMFINSADEPLFTNIITSLIP
jgi:hypothetical protein